MDGLSGGELPGDGTAAREVAEDERAELGAPDSELPGDKQAEHAVAVTPLSEPELSVPEVAEPEVAGLEMAQDEPVTQDAAEDQPPGDQPPEGRRAEDELAEARPAADQMAEPEQAEPDLPEPELSEPEVAEPVVQPAHEVLTGAPPEEDRPAEGIAGEEGAAGYRPDEDQPAENASPGAGPPVAPASPWAPPIVVVRNGSSTRPAMVERALSGPGQHRAGTNWREHVRVVPGGHGPGRPDMERRDRARVLLPIHGPRLIVVLGCTVGAGQSVTTLMLADVLAALRGEPVAALDLNPGQTSLAGLARTSPAATARGLLGGSASIVPGQRGRGRLDLIAHDSAPDGGPALADEEYARVLEVLTSRYPLTLTDPGASAVARVLSTANQLVLVAPASADAARAVAMTMEWLDGHGYGELCTQAITVINGVSKRSMTHVEQAELVVRGRCRAIVRVPWDDHLGAPPSEQGISDAADAESRFAQLRPQVQLAYTALAGVLVSALALEGNRAASPGAAGPPDGTPQRWVAR
jgi:MinD-like ATPase involved in chromosome partitioning or flagellar assembly